MIARKVAAISTPPGVFPVTRPLLLTVAIAWSDDCQAAWLVTSCVVRSEKVAVAESCAVAPTSGAGPVTDSDVTVGLGGATGAAGVAVVGD